MGRFKDYNLSGCCKLFNPSYATAGAILLKHMNGLLKKVLGLYYTY